MWKTQNVKCQSCGNTNVHSAKLWKHKMAMVNLVPFCVSTNVHFARLCFHKRALCHFMETQKLHSLFIDSIV